MVARCFCADHAASVTILCGRLALAASASTLTDSASHAVRSTSSDGTSFTPVSLTGRVRGTSVRTDRLLGSLSRPSHLLLLYRLARNRCYIDRLRNLINIKRPDLSRRLNVLHGSRLIAAQHSNGRVCCDVTDSSTLTILRLLCRHFYTGASTWLIVRFLTIFGFVCCSSMLV